VDFHSVEVNGDFVADHFGFDGLPFAGFAGDHEGGGFDDVKGAVAVQSGLFHVAIVEDLNLMPAAQVEAAVGAFGHHVFVANDEVFVFFLADKIGPCSSLVGTRLTRLPSWTVQLLASVGVPKFPAGHVFAVEDGFEAVFLSSLERWTVGSCGAVSPFSRPRANLMPPRRAFGKCR